MRTITYSQKLVYIKPKKDPSILCELDERYKRVSRLCSKVKELWMTALRMFHVRPSTILLSSISYLWFTCQLPMASAELAYDCAKTSNPVASFSLLDVGSCPDFEGAYKEPESTRVQILQRSNEALVEAFQCSLTLSRKACRCQFEVMLYYTTTH